MLIEMNTFQKNLADSKLSTNTYLMSVAALFQKLQQSYTVQDSRSTTSFAFVYPNLMISLLQHISCYFNINTATFVCFQIAVYIRCAEYFYIHKPKQPEWLLTLITLIT